MKYIIYIAVYFTLHFTTLAQHKTLRFNHLSVQDGLSRSWVKCFLEDHTGLLWIGTADGLNKYDGQDFKIYKYLPSHPNGLNHNNINLIFEDSKGRLWIGTQGGLNRYQRNLNEFVSCSSINNYVTSIYELEPDNLLLGTAGGLFLYDVIHDTSTQLYSNFYVERIVKDHNKNIWIATHEGLMLFDPTNNQVSYINSKASEILKHILIKSMFQDSRGGLWIGTAAQGLFYLNCQANATNSRIINFKHDPAKPEQINPGAIYALAEDEEHNLWIGIENGGISLLNLESFDRGHYSFTTILSNPSDFFSLSNNSIYTLYMDKQHTMWVGTYAGGADYYNRLLQRFGHHEAIPNSTNSINNKYINTLLDEDHYLWVGTEKGLNRYNKKTDRWDYFLHNFNDPHSIGSNAVLTAMRDSQNKLWLGTWSGGLNLYDERSNTFERFKNDPEDPASIGSDNIRKIIESNDHLIWIGLIGGGVAVYHPQEKIFTHFRERPGYNALSSNWIADLLEDHRGNIWISTTEAVDMLNPRTKHFTSFTHHPDKPGSINYNGANCLFQDSNNTIWLGTSNGLNYFVEKDSSFHHYTMEDGLPNNFIKAITEDKEGNIWLSTNNSLTMLKKGIELPDTPEFRSFSVFEGLPSSEFVACAVFKNKEGSLYFGSTNGYFVFDPSHIRSNEAIPKIVFTELRINNLPVKINAPDSPLQQDISVTSQLQLTRKQNVFTIGFAALNFIEPQSNQYAYKLEGFDEQWNYVGNQRSATYTNLDPGHYTFRVKASNNDGIWNEEGVALEMIILPAWWETTYAKLVYLALIILAIFFFRKHTIISVNLKNVLWREHLEKEKSEELTQMKQQFFANVSHEIRTPLTLILGPLHRLLKEYNKIPELGTIYRNSNRLKMLVDQFLDFNKMEDQKMMVSPARAEMMELTQRIITNFTDYAGQKKVKMKLEASFSKCVTMIDLDKYEKILTNLLSNAVKSIAREGSVLTQLEFDMKTTQFCLKVTDNGCGISEDESKHIFERFYSGKNTFKNSSSTGIGLYLVKELVELQKGTIHFESTAGQGSTFAVRLPLPYLEFESSQKKIVFDVNPLEGESGTIRNTPLPFEHTVLIIEDNPDMSDYLETILNKEFNVIKENNPLTCIDKIINYMPDLVVSDIMMPEMDGFQLCKLIKEDIRFSHIPVVLLTAKTTKSDHIIGYETGADDYIYKPFDEEILKARVRSLIARIQKLKQHFIGHDGIIDPCVQTNELDIKFMEDVLKEIKENYLNPEFNVNQIVEKMGMSRSLFYKKFKSLSDLSVNDLIKNFRLKKAAKLLADGNLTVSQVAYECGFTDPAYFSRVFKEYYQVAPKDFPSHRKIA